MPHGVSFIYLFFPPFVWVMNQIIIPARGKKMWVFYLFNQLLITPNFAIGKVHQLRLQSYVVLQHYHNAITTLTPIMFEVYDIRFCNLNYRRKKCGAGIKNLS